jgi:hypothetical protein
MKRTFKAWALDDGRVLFTFDRISRRIPGLFHTREVAKLFSRLSKFSPVRVTVTVETEDKKD